MIKDELKVIKNAVLSIVHKAACAGKQLKIALQSHINNTADVHGATPKPLPGRLITRNGDGRAQIADPEKKHDIVSKAYADRLSNSLKEDLEAYIAAQPRILTAPVTVYVRADGDDSNDGSEDTPEKALRTVAGVHQWLKNTIQLGHLITVSFATGVYDHFFYERLDGPVTITSTDPSSLETCAVFPLIGSIHGAFLRVDTVHIRYDEELQYELMLLAHRNSYLGLTGTVFLSGGPCVNAISSYLNSSVCVEGSTAKIVFNDVTVTEGALNARENSILTFNNGALAEGTVTGRKYRIDSMGLIAAYGQTPEAFPGTEPGVLNSGGMFLV